MTQTMSPYHVIFEAEPGFTDAAFTIDELRDIVNAVLESRLHPGIEAARTATGLQPLTVYDVICLH